MTDLSPVKAVLVNALFEEVRGHEDHFWFSPHSETFGVEGCEIDDAPHLVPIDADRLAATVTAHFLDREKVRAVVLPLLNDAVNYIYPHDAEEFIDRLIAALAGAES